MTVKNRAGTPLVIRGRYTDIGLYIDPATGEAKISRQQTVGFDIDDVSEIVESDESYKNWIVELIAPNGDSVSGRMHEPIVNRGLGYVQSPLIVKE